MPDRIISGNSQCLGRKNDPLSHASWLLMDRILVDSSRISQLLPAMIQWSLLLNNVDMSSIQVEFTSATTHSTSTSTFITSVSPVILLFLLYSSCFFFPQSTLLHLPPKCLQIQIGLRSSSRPRPRGPTSSQASEPRATSTSTTSPSSSLPKRHSNKKPKSSRSSSPTPSLTSPKTTFKAAATAF